MLKIGFQGMGYRSGASDFSCRGVADNVLFQRAIDELDAAGGGRLDIERGSYNLEDSVVIKPNVEVVCDFGATFTWDSTAFSAFVTDDEVTNFKWRGGSFNAGAPHTGTPPREYHAFYIRHGSSNILIEDVYSTRIASGSIRFRDDCYDFKIVNCKAEYTDALAIVSVGCNRFDIVGCTVLNTYAEGIYMENVYDFVIDRMYFEGCGREQLIVGNLNTGDDSHRGQFSNIKTVGGRFSGISMRGLHDSQFHNITSRENQRDGLLFDACNNITLSDVQANNNNLANSTYAGIRGFNCNNVNILNPKARGNAYGVRLHGTTGNNTLVGGETVENSTTNCVFPTGSNSRATAHIGLVDF